MFIIWISHGQIHICAFCIFFHHSFCVNYVRWKIKNCEVILACQDQAEAHVKSDGADLTVFWEQVSCTVTIFSLTAFKSSCRDVSFLLQCRCTSYSDCFTPATYAPGLHVWLVCVIHATPWSTATQLYDADKSCHLSSFRAEWGHILAADHTDKNKCGWGFVERVGADKMKRGEELHPVGCLQSPLKKFLFQISTMSAEAMEREAPCPPSGQQEKRLNDLKADIWEARSVPNCTVEESTAESLLDRRQDWVWVILNSDNIMCALWTEYRGCQHLQFNTTFAVIFTTVFVHTA